MIKITGLDKLQRELEEAKRVLTKLDGELGTVNFNPHDPSSIEIAIQVVNRMIDDRVGGYASNPIVGPLIDRMKITYQENILERAAKARLQEC
ncbi:MAG: hypothetical protein C4516_09035 [Oxalobacter sp.]|nr:MAG: hypothetical protein C4516_09035 [Oxalobacter sp.]